MEAEPLATEFTKQFGIKYPIVSAPMFLVSDVNMVVATGLAGGLGTFPALNYRPIEAYRKSIQEIKSKTQAPFGINIIVQKSNRFQHEQLSMALEEKVPLIVTSLGSPKDIIRKAHEVGTRVYCDVIGLDHAKKVEDLGADGLIAVSAGAGGHAGGISPFALLPYLRAHSRLPILAAGAIVDGKGLLAALALGASGIYMGTRFVASKECTVDSKYKEAILQAGCEDIVNTHRVDGFPGNFIMTEDLKKVGLEDGLMEQILTRSQKVKRMISLGRAARSLFGGSQSKVSYKTVFSAGQGVGLIDDTPTISEIIQFAVKEYRTLKAKLP